MENYINSLFSINHALQNGFKSILDKYKVSNFSLSERQIPICRIERKENVVDSVLCKGSKKYLFYNAFRHTIQSATKNNKWQ